MIELLVAIAVVVIIVAILSPAFFRARKPADVSACISNVRQILMAVKLYEADYGALPVHMGPTPAQHWISKIDPYVNSKDDIFVCPLDKTHGEVYAWGGNRNCSYIYFYTSVHLGKGGAYREPTPASPLVGCRAHDSEYQMVLGRNDGSIELPPPHRYHALKVMFPDSD